MKAVFIVNPAARGGKALGKWAEFRRTVAFPYQEFMTIGPGHAKAIARGFAAQPGQENILLIAFGGDGTVHEIITGAAGAGHVVVGSVGAGSGNDFGRGFSSFGNAEEIAAYLDLRQDTPALDLGHAGFKGGLIFVNSSGIGFDAEISRGTGRSSMKPLLNRMGLGKFVYALYTVRALFTFRTFSLEVMHDEERLSYRDVWFATVSNQPYYGGGMKISPQSDPADGLLELTVVSRLSRMKLLAVFGSVFFGAHTAFREVDCRKSRSFSLKADRAVPLHADGEDAGDIEPGSPVVFTVKQKAWRLAGQQRTGRSGIKHESTP
ncbi:MULTISPECIES: diacylglycerol/lipid kinase family protein [Bhargavaea]|uniref:Diacylglycerol/lipid kinase family protein n=1 Tax=Bhargavaea changchunensis TaxID=2134037 RepID=A0ABW2NBK5_9BACL|nr:diacylglycerol kinase family protein [Bhargavaea sp. CC-171006]